MHGNRLTFLQFFINSAINWPEKTLNSKFHQLNSIKNIKWHILETTFR